MHLAYAWNDAELLDAKLIDWDNGTLKFGHDGVLRCLDPGLFSFESNLFHFVPMCHHEEYKYLLYVEGNGCFGRLGSLLASGSVVLVVETLLTSPT